MDEYLKFLGPKGRILDAGCGSGRDSIEFMSRVYDVEMLDGSLEICRIASRNANKMVEWSDLRNINYCNEFDGVWAVASLLHLDDNDLIVTLVKLRKALKNNGIIYASFKYGADNYIDRGRFYNDLTELSVKNLFRMVGFEPLKVFITYSDNNVKWINIIARK